MKLLYVNLAVLLVVIAVIAMAGFRGHHFARPPFEIFPDMNYQPKVKDQQPSTFFADGVAARLPVDGTVAEEMPAVLDYWATGRYDATHWGDGIPVHPARDGGRALAVSAADLARGRERYAINCAVCHGAAGDGKGITSSYGINATSYQSDRLRTMNDGELFNTIANGKGQMMGYGYNIEIDDRWRIVMYLRALQHAQNAKLEEASPAEQAQLNEAKNKKTTDNFRIEYLDRKTMVGWMDSQDLGGVLEHAPRADYSVPVDLIGNGMVEVGPSYHHPFDHPAQARAQPAVLPSFKIKYLNRKTAKGWYEGDLSDQF